MLADPESDQTIMFGYDKTLASASLARAVTCPEGVTARPVFTEMAATSGLVDSGLLGQADGLVAAFLAYRYRPTAVEPPVPPGDELPGQPGEDPELWVGLVGSPQNLWMPLEHGLGEALDPLPRLGGASLFFDAREQRLYLLGDEVVGAAAAGERNVLHVLDLYTGSVTRLGRVQALGELSGYSASYDPVKRHLVVFGGLDQGQASGQVIAVDPATLLGHVLWADGETGFPIARTLHGVHLDPESRTLTVYGGERDGQSLTDALQFHLGSRTWSELWPDGAGGAGARTRPLVRYDRQKNRLWVAGGSAEEIDPELVAWELSLERGEWHARRSLSFVEPSEPGTRELTFSDDAPLWRGVTIDDGAPLQGEVRLVEALAADPDLELWAFGDRFRPVGADRRAVPENRLLLLGQPGNQYRVQVKAGPGFEAGRTVTLTYRNRVAELVLASTQRVSGGVRDLLVDEPFAYVVHAGGISSFDLTDPQAPVRLDHLATRGIPQEAAKCGPHHLCVAQTYGLESLQVIDVADPSDLRLVSGRSLPGLCRSIAARDSTVQLACGLFGVHLVNVVDPTDPRLLYTLDVGGLAVDVAVRRELMAVSLGSRKVALYRLEGASEAELLVEVDTARRPVQARFNGDRLHVAQVGWPSWARCLAGVRCGPGQLVEVFALDAEETSLSLVGSDGGQWAGLPHAALLWDHALVPTRRGFKVFQAQAVE